MFNRFTSAARGLVLTAVEESEQLDFTHISATSLLLAAAAPDGPLGDLARSQGLDHAKLRRLAAPLGVRDSDALRTLGIDLDEIRRNVEATFGNGALDAPRHRAREGWPWKRRGWGGGSTHLLFTAGAKKSLQLSLRQCLRLGHHEILPEHILLGVLAADDAEVADVLERAGIDEIGLRRAVENRLRRSA